MINLDSLLPDSVSSASDQFVIVENPRLSGLDGVPFKTEWIVSHFCTAGSLWGRINFKEFRIEQGQMIIMMPGQLISDFGCTGDYRGTMVLMTMDFVENIHIADALTWSLDMHKEPCYILPPKAVPATVAFVQLSKAIIDMDSSPSVVGALQRLTNAYFLGVGNLLLEQKPLSLSTNRSSELAERFLDLVWKEYRRHRDISYYSSELCLTPKYLSRAVKHATGLTASRWIERSIVLDAETQLQDTRRTIDQISDSLGFPSASFFGKYFKRVTGLSPRQWRKTR